MFVARPFLCCFSVGIIKMRRFKNEIGKIYQMLSKQQSIISRTSLQYLWPTLFNLLTFAIYTSVHVVFLSVFVSFGEWRWGLWGKGSWALCLLLLCFAVITTTVMLEVWRVISPRRRVELKRILYLSRQSRRWNWRGRKTHHGKPHTALSESQRPRWTVQERLQWREPMSLHTLHETMSAPAH